MYEDALNMKKCKNLPHLLSLAFNHYFKSYKDFKYEESYLDQLILKTLTKVKDTKSSFEVYAVIIELNK